MMQKVTSHQIVLNLVTLRGQNGEKLYACKFRLYKKCGVVALHNSDCGCLGGGLPMSVCLCCSTFAVRHNST